MVNTIEAEILALLARIRTASPKIESIWLIGSRANDCARATSDWDFIAFANKPALSYLRNASELHHSNVDFLVVVNGDDFENAWGERDKTGSLSSWDWRLLSDTHAEYTEAKWVEDEDGGKVALKRRNAFRIN